jgi:hypothetical protein
MNQPQKTIQQHNIETGQLINNVWQLVAAEVSDGSTRSPEGYQTRFWELYHTVQQINDLARETEWGRFQEPTTK